MEIRKQTRDGAKPSLAGIEQQVGGRVAQLKQQWLTQLSEHPEQFGQIELAVHETFGHLADELTAALLAEAGASEAFSARKKNRGSGG